MPLDQHGYYGYTVGVPNVGVSVATDGCDARIINLNSSVEKGLVDKFPYYAFATIPKGTYKTTTSDVTTFGVMATFVTSAASLAATASPERATAATSIKEMA